MVVLSIMCCRIIGKVEINKSFQQGVPDTLSSPSPEAHGDQIPFAGALVPVTSWAANTQHIKHAIEEQPIVSRR